MVDVVGRTQQARFLERDGEEHDGCARVSDLALMKALAMVKQPRAAGGVVDGAVR